MQFIVKSASDHLSFSSVITSFKPSISPANLAYGPGTSIVFRAVISNSRTVSGRAYTMLASVIVTSPPRGRMTISDDVHFCRVVHPAEISNTTRSDMLYILFIVSHILKVKAE